MDNSTLFSNILFIILLVNFFFFISKIFIDLFFLRKKLDNFPENKKSSKIDSKEFEIKGNFMGREWVLLLQINDNLKLNQTINGYEVDLKSSYSSKTLNIITELSNFDSNSIDLEHQSYEYPIFLSGNLIDLKKFIVKSDQYNLYELGLANFYLIDYYVDDINLNKKLKDTLNSFEIDVLPTVKDIAAEFTDSLEDKIDGVKFRLFNLNDIKSSLSHYDNIDILTITIPNFNELRISKNAYNHFLYKFIYQIEVVINSENLNLQVEFGRKDNWGINTSFVFIKFPIKELKWVDDVLISKGPIPIPIPANL